MLLGCLLAAPLYAQTDSLETRLAQVSGREKMEALAALVEANWSNDPEQAIAYGREALALLRTYPEAALEGNVLFQKGSAHYVVSEYDSALAHAERLIAIAEVTGNTKGLAEAASLMGRVYRRQGDYEQALTVYERALRYYEALDDASGIAGALDYIGLIYRNLGDYDQALDFHLRALESKEERGDQRGVSITLNNMGHVYRNLGDYNQARVFYQRALAIKEDVGDKRGVAIALFSIGDIHELQGREEEALGFFMRTLTIDEELGDKHGIAITLNKIGEAHRSLGNHDQALDFFLRALAVFEEIGDKPGVVIGLISISAAYQELGDFTQALAVTRRALAIAEEIDAQQLIRDSYQTLADIYEEQGRFEEALAAHRQYKAAHDSLFNSESQSVISELQTQYRTREQQQEIELLNRQRQIQRLWLGGLVGGLVFLALVAFLIYSRYRLKHRANRTLERVNNTLEESMRRLTETQDRLIHAEKMASLGAMTAGIAHEIKNPLNFVNNFARLSVGLADDLAHELDENAGKTVADIRGDVGEMLDDLKFNARKIDEHSQRADGIVESMILHASVQPGQRQSTDLNALLEEDVNLVHHTLQAQQPDFDVTLERHYDEALGPVEVVPQEMARVFLNLLNNAFDAVREKALVEDEIYTPTVVVHTQKAADHVEIRVGDNGAGVPAALQDKIFEPFFTTKPAGTGTGLGLSLSHEIVTQGHGGTLTVESEEGQGATMVIRLPCN